MTSIVEFLRARLDEDEAVARGAIVPAHVGYKPHPELSEWVYQGDEVEYAQTPEMLGHKYPENYYVTMDSEGLTPAVGDEVGPHIARHDPARVLREVEAKRALLDECVDVINLPGGWEYDDTPNLAWFALRGLAAAYSDHPDYREEWAL